MTTPREPQGLRGFFVGSPYDLPLVHYTNFDPSSPQVAGVMKLATILRLAACQIESKVECSTSFTNERTNDETL
jgi:hypothetical protein